jgi:uncharacterized protein YabN with tetrapyrrole methylase and pyrophosphatase domain
MSSTPEYYYRKRWVGLENLAKIIGKKESSNRLSLGEKFQDLEQVINTICESTIEIRNSIFDNSLSEDAFLNELKNLQDRVNEAINELKSGLEEVMDIEKRMLISFANHRADKFFKSQDNGRIAE